MKVIFPGTFDPITLGHVDIIKRASLIFPAFTVAVAVNRSKSTLLPLNQRFDMVNELCHRIQSSSNIDVITYDSMLVDLFDLDVPGVVIRGIRSNKDISYENNMAHMNQQLRPYLDTVFFPSIAYAHVSSSLVREVLLHGGDISPFVPDHVTHFFANRQHTS